MPKDRNNYRSERVRSHLSADDVADSVGVSKNTVLSWERGDTEPAASQLETMARLFGCTIDYLLALTDERVG